MAGVDDPWLVGFNIRRKGSMAVAPGADIEQTKKGFKEEGE
jgi:hypothetical protein